MTPTPDAPHGRTTLAHTALAHTAMKDGRPIGRHAGRGAACDLCDAIDLPRVDRWDSDAALYRCTGRTAAGTVTPCRDFAAVPLGAAFDHFEETGHDLQRTTPAGPDPHTKDADCDVDVSGTGCCYVCGVYHVDDCRLCGGRGFHVDSCGDVDPAGAPTCCGPRGCHTCTEEDRCSACAGRGDCGAAHDDQTRECSCCPGTGYSDRSCDVHGDEVSR